VSVASRRTTGARARRGVARFVDTRLRRARPDLADVQGNVLRPYDDDHAAFLLVQVHDPAAGRQLLRELLPHVTPATPWVVPPAVTHNVALTHRGLQRLGMSDADLRSFPVAFREGMAHPQRSAMLGDRGRADPDRWEPGLRDDTAHVLVTLTAWRGDRLDDRADQLADRIRSDDGLRLAHRQRAERFEDRREHFGFLDGIAQPALAGIDPPGTPAAGTPGRFGWAPLPVGEFVLGHPDAEGLRPPVPAGGWATNGSYVVVRKLHQDVAAFRSLVHHAGARYPGGPAQLAAKLVGRWPDGTPLALAPEGPDPALADDPARINDFRYGDDLDGLRCPVGAHIRRANPRDGAGVGGALTTRHRMLRRGLPYGPRLAPGADDDGVDRGLVFVCFVADIERQFEFLQRRWLDDGDVLGLRGDPDPLLGIPEEGRSFRCKVPGDPPFLLEIDRPLVVPRGGAYLFQPGLGALAALASGTV
jgi:Dyp-type peroxidase family